jgi:hypothetical protein
MDMKAPVKIKAFLWIVFTVLVFVSWAMWVLAVFTYPLVKAEFAARPLPDVSLFIYQQRTWLLVCPLPWLPYCIVSSVRSVVCLESALLYAATVAACVAFLVLFSAFAMLLPWIKIVQVM